jgi:putative effector of murein hydrolase LrgA (UPF0299 family)
MFQCSSVGSVGLTFSNMQVFLIPTMCGLSAHKNIMQERVAKILHFLHQPDIVRILAYINPTLSVE